MRRAAQSKHTVVVIGVCSCIGVHPLKLVVLHLYILEADHHHNMTQFRQNVLQVSIPRKDYIENNSSCKRHATMWSQRDL